MRARAAVSAGMIALVLGCTEPARPTGPSGLGLQDTDVPAGLQLTAALGGDSLVYLVVHNTTGVPDTISHGVCAFAARIYDGPDLTHLAWQSVPVGEYFCALSLVVVVVPASDSVRMITARLAAALPGIGPPPAYGQVRAYIKVNGQLVELVAGIRDIRPQQTVGQGRRAG